MTGVDILATDDQEQMLAAVGAALADLFPLSRLDHGRAVASFTAADWTRAADLGWTSMLLLDGEAGGYDLTDATLLHRLHGRHLVTPCLAATVVAARLAAQSGDGRISQALAEGRAHAAFAVARAGETAGGCHLLDADDADVLVLLTPEGALLLDRARVADMRAVGGIDSTIPLSRARLPAEALTATGDRQGGLFAQALIASELSGLALAASDQARDYAKLRHQFGKPIGAFQAVAHQCANNAMRAEAAVVQANFAAISVRDQRADADFQIAAASLIASDAAFQNATTNIQVHGGMGYSAESDAHLYLKRAILLRALLGGDDASTETLLSGSRARS